MTNFKFLSYTPIVAMISMAVAHRVTAEIVSYGGFTVPQTGDLTLPDAKYQAMPDNTCNTATASKIENGKTH